MSRLIKIAGWGGRPRASVIFVHGLGGHAYDTWRRDARRREAPEDVTFWPLWLAEDVGGISVYTLAYEAPASNWLGTSMPLQDRAVNVLEVLLSEPGLKNGPIIFICHSLGGLIVKQILLDLQQQRDRRKEAKDLLGRVTQVVFAATPHTGAQQATLLDRLRFLAWPSSIARTLVANDPTLRSINVAYRVFADECRDLLQHRVFYETQGTPAGVIVDEASTDPGLPGDPPVLVDADHISIVKPIHRFSVLYARTRDFIASNPPIPEAQEGALEVYPLPPIRSEQPLNIVPKLIRIAAISLVLLVGYKGVQALISPSPEQQLATKDVQIAALTAQNAELIKLTNTLLERNPSAMGGPGAQQAVGEAVQSIAQGASEGDKRLQQALALLKDNKVAEATQLLTAVAEDKSAHAEQAVAQAEKDRKEAAIAYRNLGAIAGLADPKSALQAYEKAALLDPGDIESLFWAGWIEIQYGDLGKAQMRLEHVLKLAEQGNQADYKYWARVGLADIWQKRGDLKAALKSYSDSLAIAERLAKSDPGNAGWQRDLAVSYEKIGDVQEAQGDLKAALKSYSGSLAIAERLAKADPGNKEWQRDLVVSYNRIGGVQGAQGDLKAALKSYSDSLTIMEQLAQSDPGNAGWQRDLSVCYNKIGDVQGAQGDLKAALKSYSDSLAIREHLAKSDPGNAGLQRDLSVCYNKIGDVQGAQGDLKAALKSYSDSLAIREHLAKSDPGNAEWQRGLSVSYEKIGGVQEAQGDLKAALKSYSDSLAMRERLAKADPGNMEWQRDLSVSYNKIGDVQVAQGDLKAALKSYSDSLAIRERLAQSDPSNMEWQGDLAVCYDRIGDVQVAQGDLKAALKSYSDSLTIMEQLAQSDPGNAEWQRDLSVSYNKIGDVQGAQGDLKAALKSCSDSLAIRERLAKADRGNAQWQRDLSVSYDNVSGIYRKLNETAKAREALAAGRAIIEKLVEQHPDQTQWKQDLARLDASIAELGKTSPRKKPAQR
jgi:tetratricopeptide (TPR) repeat protein/pimeloyl-ACP methyl ester carboxylesterase